jgi:spermidine synthase
LAIVLDRVQTPRGELVLRQDGDHFEVISNGTFLMDTRNGKSERALVRAALERAQEPRSIFIGGLGVGFSLIEALSDERVTRVRVAEIEKDVIEWHDKYLQDLTGEARSDERTEIVNIDVREALRRSDEKYDAICLDTDNGPDWLVSETNNSLYGDDGTALLASRLTAAGVLTVWGAARSTAYEQVLRRHFGKVDVIEIPVPRGEPDVVFVAADAISQTQGRDSDSS